VPQTQIILTVGLVARRSYNSSKKCN